MVFFFCFKIWFLLTADVIIKENLQNLKHIEKETAKLQCKVKNPTKYPVKWFRNDVEINPVEDPR